MKPFVSAYTVFDQEFGTADAVQAKMCGIFDNRRMRRRRMLFAA